MSQLIFWSNSKTNGLDTKWPKTVLLPQQSKTAWNSFEKVIPNCVVSTRTGQKRYYFHSRAKQLGTQPFLYTPSRLKKVIPNCFVSARTGPKQYYFHSRAKQLVRLVTAPFLYPKQSEKVIPNCVVSARTGPKRYCFHIRASFTAKKTVCRIPSCTENHVIRRQVLRLADQHRTRISVKRTVHWNRVEPNRLRTEPTRIVLEFLSDFANLHESKRTAGSLSNDHALTWFIPETWVKACKNYNWIKKWQKDLERTSSLEFHVRLCPIVLE